MKRSLAARGASLGCDECGTQTRRVDLECAFGAHYARHLCSACAGREMLAVYGGTTLGRLLLDRHRAFFTR